MNSYRILIGIVATGIVSATAFAADLKAPMYKAPPPPAAWSWTGAYIGLNGGYSWGKADSTILPQSIAATPVGQNVNGGVFGGQAGYNWQLSPKWLVGVEGDIQITGQRDSRSGPLASLQIPSCLGDCTLLATIAGNLTTSLPWFATFRGRAGVLVDPTWLIYGTAGLAVGEVKYEQQLTLTLQQIRPIVLPAISASAPAVFDSQTRVGWTVGAGTEKKFNKNWSAKLEYIYLDFGSQTYLAGTGAATGVRFTDHILRGGVNYAFDAQPIVARY
jgi:opacity protein-like surface antigen